jgi:hypothetical protein
MLALHALAESNREVAIKNAQQREIEKLGVSGPARADAVVMFLRGRYGDRDSAAMITTLRTESQIRIWEDLIGKVTGQGAGSFRQTGREAEPQKMSDAEWSRMTYSQQKDYAERATARNNSGGRR